MICKQCNSEISEGSKFCQSCGAKTEIETVKKFCLECGCEIESTVKFCPKCGKNQMVNVKQNNALPNNELTSGKLKGTYFVSVISAIISFIIRVATQSTYYSWSNLLDNRKVVGIDPDTKPFLTAIPAIAAIIVTLMIVTDKNSSTQKKVTALIVNLIFIVLAVLFIWFDLPYAIIDI